MLLRRDFLKGLVRIIILSTNIYLAPLLSRATGASSSKWPDFMKYPQPNVWNILRSFEHRHPTRNVNRFLQRMSNQGVGGLVVGPLDGKGYSQYPSQNFPEHPKMIKEWIPDVIHNAHDRGMFVTAWLPFNCQDVRDARELKTVERFPEWRMEFFGESPDKRRRVGMCVVSSPYREWYANALKEVLKFDFDAFWFDGFFLGGLPHPILPGCVCPFCQKKFSKDTGHNLPEKIDWNDDVFKLWIRWRNKTLLDTAHFFSETIRSKHLNVPISFNFNSWPSPSKDWETGVPLLRMDPGIGVSQHAYVFNRPDWEWLILGFKSRLSHDLNPRKADIWRNSSPSFPYSEESLADKQRHIMDLETFALTAITYGVVPWVGGKLPGRSYYQMIAEREPWFGGECLSHVGVLISQSTVDFWGHSSGVEKRDTYQDAVLGTWLGLTENQVLFEFIFDNQLSKNFLSSFKILVLPLAAAIASLGISALQDWVSAGGVLIVSGLTGMFDEYGNLHRDHWSSSFFLQEKKLKMERSQGFSEKVFGKGRVVRFYEDPGLFYCRQRDSLRLQALVGLIQEGCSPIDILEAPPDLVVSAYIKEKENYLLIHLLNISHYMSKNDIGFRGVNLIGNKRKVQRTRNAIRNIKIRVNIQSDPVAVLAMTGEQIVKDSRGILRVPRVDNHIIVIVKIN